MLAFANHLLQMPDVCNVDIHPDGEHAKQFDIRAWLESHGFKKIEKRGSTRYGGVYILDGRTISVTPKSGMGDVVALVGGQSLVAECKGGIINTRHSGQTSKLQRGLSEAIGLLIVRPESERERKIAVVPNTATTLRIAERITKRTNEVGIEIALVDEKGNVLYIDPNK
jgi:hypothetical protein